MIIALPTEYGAGIEIFGDYWDLENACRTIHKLTGQYPFKEEDRIQDFAITLAYDLRKAYEKQREERTFGIDSYDTVVYRGVKILWPIFLFQLALLRWSASYNPTTKEDQSNLFRLEHCAEKALNEFDPVVAPKCISWLESFSGIPDSYLIQYTEEVCYKYKTTHGNEKGRFKKLPLILNSFKPFSEEYKKYENHLKKEAEKSGQNISEFIIDRPTKEFKW